jgi:hypothetical protein
VLHRPGAPNEVIFGHDGGVTYTDDVSQSPVDFVERNRNYNVTQFYSVTQSPVAEVNLMLGGTQDNGTPKLNHAGIGPEVKDVTGGDGGYAHISQNGSGIAIASNQWLQWHRSLDGGVTFSYLGRLSSGGSFINPSDLDEDANHLFFHYDENRIGRLNNVDSSPVTWDALGPTGGFGAPVTHVRNSDFAPTGKSTVFVGTRVGSIYRVDNAEVGASAVWTELNTTPLPVAAISSIELIGNEQTMLVTFSNYGVASVWRTTDGGATWQDLDTGRGLPDIPVWWVLADPANPDLLYLGTESGLWVLPGVDNGSSWYADPDVPTTRVVMLQHRTSDGRIVVATHGRGLWSTGGAEQVNPRIAIKLLLEGAYQGSGLMETSAAFAGAIPSEQPYGSLVDNSTPLGKSSEGLPDNMIDWVVVSLRSDTSSASQLPGSLKSGHLMDDGRVLADDGSLIEFGGVAPGSYFLVVSHRNHLSVMSSQPVDLTSGTGSWDFTAGAEKVYGLGSRSLGDLGDGLHGIYAADANQDGQVTAADFNIFLAQTKAVTQGYVDADFNFDGQVTALDFNILLRNTKMAVASQVPN